MHFFVKLPKNPDSGLVLFQRFVHGQHIILYSIGFQIVRGMLIPSYFATGVLLAECDGKEECDDTKKLVRARDLPLYADPPKPLAKYVPYINSQWWWIDASFLTGLFILIHSTNTLESEEGVLLTTIRCARQELQAIVVQAKAIRSEVSHMIDQTTKETEGT